MRTPIIIAAVVALGAPGCGSSEDSSDPASARERNRDALVKFARCMRQQGIDMPDPATSEDGGFRIIQEAEPGRDVPSEAEMLAAEEKCAKFREAVTPPKISEEQRAEFRKQALAHAKCMRENGVDFPDPKFDEGGGATMRLGVEGVDLNDADFRRADEKCRKHLGRAGGVMAAPGAE